MKPNFNLKSVILISLIYSTLDVMWMVYNSYVPIYFQAGNPDFQTAAVGVIGFGFGPALTGLLMTLDNVTALIVSPLVGMWSDSLRSKRGRRLPFILSSMPFMVLALVAIPLFPQMIPAGLNGQTAQLTGYLLPFMAFLVLLMISNSVMWGPGRSLLFDVTPSEHRTTANAVANIIDGVLLVLVVLGGAALYNLYKPLPLWVAGLFILAAVIIVSIWIREPHVEGDSVDKATSPRQILQMLRGLHGEEARSLIFFMISMLFTYMAISEVQAFITSYSVSVLQVSMSTASMLLAIFAIIGLLMAVPAALLANRFGRKRIMLVGTFLCLAQCALTFFVPSIPFVMISAGIIGIGWILSNISHTPMMVDHAPSDKYLGTYVSLIFVISTVGFILGPIIGGWVVENFGSNYGLIWPLMALFFGIAFIAMLPVTRGEAKKTAARLAPDLKEEVTIPV